MNVDIGANWIHNLNDSNQCFQLLKKMKLKHYPTSSDDEPSSKDLILFHNGKQIDSNYFDQWYEKKK